MSQRSPLSPSLGVSVGPTRRLLSFVAIGSSFLMMHAHLAGCLVPTPSSEIIPSAQLTNVRPRIVVDGMVDLAVRTNGRIFIDEVVLHTPDVVIGHLPETHAQMTTSTLFGDSSKLYNVLASDPHTDEGLFFHHNTSNNEGYATALGGDRLWDLHNNEIPLHNAGLFFHIAPFYGDNSQIEALSQSLAYEATPMIGNSVYIRGYVAINDDDSDSFLVDIDHDAVGSVNHYDENAAMTDLANSGDPDGAPAEGTNNTGSNGDDDNQQSTKKTKTNNAVASGDPDGAPAEGTGQKLTDALDNSRTRQRAKATRFSIRQTTVRDLSSATLVPFSLYLADDFVASIPMQSLPLSDDGNTLPIDLHVDISSLLDGAQLLALSHAVHASAHSTTGGFAVSLDMPNSNATHVFSVEVNADTLATSARSELGRVRIKGGSGVHR